MLPEPSWAEKKRGPLGNAAVTAEGSDPVKLWLGRVLQHPGLM